MLATYLVPESNLQRLHDEIDALNKRAKRLGVPAITTSEVRDQVLWEVAYCGLSRWVTADKIELNEVKTGRVLPYWKVTVNGETPTYKGWTFTAVLTPLTMDDGTVENLVSNLPGETCPVDYRTRIGECDHCQAKRRRNETFVVRHEDGSFKVVGRQCLKDFLGYNGDPHKMAEWAEMLAYLGSIGGMAEDSEGGFGPGRGEPDAWGLEHFLALTAARVRLHGWLSKGKAYEMERLEHATANVVLDILTLPGRYASDDERREHAALVTEHTPSEDDGKLATAAMEWARGLEPKDDEDYLANIRLVARVGVAGRKTAGLAASIIVAYNRAVEKETKRLAWANKPVSNHVGEVGKRIKDLVLTCERVTRHDGMYGMTGIHKLHDAAGNDFTWFATGDSGNWINVDETVTVDATVKEHGEYNGRKQTIVNRVTILSDEEIQARAAKAARKAARAARKTATV